MYVRVIDWKGSPLTVPGDDPDSFIRREGPAAFQQLIDSATPYGDWIITETERGLADVDDIYVIAHAVKGLLEMAQQEPDPVIRGHYMRRISQMAKVDEAVLMTPVSPEPTWTEPARQRKPRQVAKAAYEGKKPTSLYDRTEYQNLDGLV